MGKRVRLKRGDMFRFVLDEARYGLGQIIDPGMVFYMSVLREPVGADCDLAQVDLRDILLCGRSTDALFVHDRWHVVGNLPVPDEMIPRPCVKVESGGVQWVADFNRRLLRQATAFEWAHLDYHSSRSPIAYQDAFKAHHGLGEMKSHYEKLSIEHMRAQAALCSR